MKDTTTKYGEYNGTSSRSRGKGGFVEVEVVVIKAEEEIMGTGSSISKCRQRMAFNVIIATTMGT